MTEAARGKKAVLVTGASKGIGRAIALRLGMAGFPITAHYGADRAGAEGVVAAIKEAGGAADVLGFDVRDRDATKAALEGKLAQGGAFWGVVLSAGVTRDAAFPAIEGEGWDYVLRTNLDGFYNVVHPLTMPMIRRRDGGRILAITSVSGLMGNRGQVSYSASKAGVMGAAKALAVELATRNITVNCIAPGLIETDMTKNIPDEVVASVPMKRMGTVSEVAGLAEFIFSDDAAYITRQTISVNGGLM